MDDRSGDCAQRMARIADRLLPGADIPGATPPTHAELLQSSGGLHHYRGMAMRTLEENLEGDRIGIKRLFYVLRPLLACRWIERKRAQPPTLFHALMDDELVSREERIWIEGLLKRKADAREAEPVAVNDARVNCIRAELEGYGSMSMSPAAPSSGSKDELDGLLRRWVVTHDAYAPAAPYPNRHQQP